MHQQVGREQHEADHHVVDDEVVEVGLPFGAEDRLVLAQREQLLDEDEDQRRAEQIEDEPVEADVGRVVGEVVDRHLVAAERERQRDQHECGEGQPARAAATMLKSASAPASTSDQNISSRIASTS